MVITVYKARYLSTMSSGQGMNINKSKYLYATYMTYTTRRPPPPNRDLLTPGEYSLTLRWALQADFVQCAAAPIIHVPVREVHRAAPVRRCKGHSDADVIYNLNRTRLPVIDTES